MGGDDDADDRAWLAVPLVPVPGAGFAMEYTQEKKGSSAAGPVQLVEPRNP
jgi:hypothetical protein